MRLPPFRRLLAWAFVAVVVLLLGTVLRFRLMPDDPEPTYAELLPHHSSGSVSSQGVDTSFQVSSGEPNSVVPESTPEIASAVSPPMPSPFKQSGGEPAVHVYGSHAPQWNRSTPFQLTFWAERYQAINLGSSRNFIQWVNAKHSKIASARLVECVGRNCSHHFWDADAVGIVGFIADRNKADLGAARMAQLRHDSTLQSKLHFLSLTGDEYCQLKSHQNVDYVFRNYWDDPYFRVYGAHLKGGHAAWMPMGKGHAMPEVIPADLEAHPCESRKHLFNLVVSLNTHRDRTLVKNIVASMKSPLSDNHPSFIHYTKHWSPKYDPHHNYLAPPEWKQILLQSVFTLVPSGKNQECFRMWEAMEAGSIPIVANRMQPSCGDSWVPFREPNSPVIFLDRWEDLPSFLENVTSAEASKAKQDFCSRQRHLLNWYFDFRDRHYTKILNILIEGYWKKTNRIQSALPT